MKSVELYAQVRHAVVIEGISERAAAERFGINARTVSKMLKFSVPPEYVRKGPPLRPKLDGFTGIIDAILTADRDRLKKQHHTSKRVFERLRDEHGFTGKLTIVKDYVADCDASPRGRRSGPPRGRACGCGAAAWAASCVDVLLRFSHIHSEAGNSEHPGRNVATPAPVTSVKCCKFGGGQPPLRLGRRRF